MTFVTLPTPSAPLLVPIPTTLGAYPFAACWTSFIDDGGHSAITQVGGAKQGFHENVINMTHLDFTSRAQNAAG